jgi:hypothetical protein
LLIDQAKRLAEEIADLFGVSKDKQNIANDQLEEKIIEVDALMREAKRLRELVHQKDEIIRRQDEEIKRLRDR